MKRLTTPLLLSLALVSPGQDIALKDSERDSLFYAGLSEDARDNAPPDAAGLPVEAMTSVDTPLLVTGRPPENAEFLQPLETPEPVAPEPEGVLVQVEPGSAGARAVDSSQVRLLAPFPSKPLFPPPAGWRLEHPENIPPFTRDVILENGTRISLAIRPHLLVPDAGADQAIAIAEPGYEPGLQYAQVRTVGAVLADSIQRLDEDSLRLGEALDALGQLLGSLPPSDPPSPDLQNR